MLAQNQFLRELLCFVRPPAGAIAIDVFNLMQLAVGTLDRLAVDCLIRFDGLLEL